MTTYSIKAVNLTLQSQAGLQANAEFIDIDGSLKSNGWTHTVPDAGESGR